MEPELRILMVEDLSADVLLEIRELRRANVRAVHYVVETEEAYREALREFRPHIILSDFCMPRFDGMHALSLARTLAPDVPFIFVSGMLGEENAVRALKNGATDYVLKHNLMRLPAAVERAREDATQRAARSKMERELRETCEGFQTLLETAPDAILLVNSKGTIVLGNAEMERIFGYQREELLGKPMDVLVSDAQRGLLAGYMPASRVRRMAAITDLCGRRKDGSLVPLEINLGPVVFNDETHVIGVIRDVSERREQERRIARLSRIHAVLSGINSAIVRIRDEAELFKEACRIAVEHGKFVMAWIGLADVAARKIDPIARAGRDEGYLERVELAIDPDPPGNLALAAEALARRAPVLCNDVENDPRMTDPWRAAALERGYRASAMLPLFVDRRAAGIFALYASEPGFFDEEEMKLLLEMAGDVSFAMDNIRKAERLEYLAHYDALTDLPNRTLFNDRLDQHVAAAHRDQRGFSVIMLDIERFRHVNETLGRQAGDDLLREIAGRLRGMLGETDALARIAGDTFAIAVRHEAGEDLARWLDRILNAVSGRPYQLNDAEIRVAARAGIALHPADGAGSDVLLKNAEAALKSAKTTGRHYQFYAPQMNARVAESLKLENDLRRAVLENQFVLYYQPRVEFAGGRIVGLEALLRWAHPERGMVAPSEFIALLESTGLILEIGRWALKRAAQDHGQWRAMGAKPPRVAVNVSAIQLRREDFVTDFRSLMEEAGNAEEFIDIEITESVLMEDLDGNIEKLKAVRDMGVQVALDDFGTGYSSLGHLARLPVNALKIDRSFVAHMAKSPNQMAIVSTVISLARALNLKVIAEGVETEEQANLLRLLRCDEAQGDLFHEPLPASQIVEPLLLPRAALPGTS